MNKFRVFLISFFIFFTPFTAMAQTATILPPAETQFLDANGVPYAGGHVYFYIPNTTTLKAIFLDPGSATPSPNPVTLDAAGRAIIYGTGQYSLALYDSLGNLVYNQLTHDTLGGSSTLPSQANNTFLGNVSGISAPPVAVTASQILAAIGNTQGDLLYSNGTSWVVLPPGTAGQNLQSGGPSANPAWSSSSTPTQGNNTVLGNNSGATGPALPLTASNVLDMICNTQGSVLYRNTTGAGGWLCLAPGTTGQVLTTAGAAANPSWTTPASASGALTLLSVASTAGASFVYFGSSVITSTYKKYIIEFDSVLPATNAVQMYVQVSTDNGSTWKVTGYADQVTLASNAFPSNATGMYSSSNDIGISLTGSSSQTCIPTCGGGGARDLTMANTAASLSSGTIKFSVPSSSSVVNFVYEDTYLSNSTFWAQANGSGEWLTNGPINAVRIITTSGNIAGDFKIYGLQ
jgi:hypothetical protein